MQTVFASLPCFTELAFRSPFLIVPFHDLFGLLNDSFHSLDFDFLRKVLGDFTLNLRNCFRLLAVFLSVFQIPSPVIKKNNGAVFMISIM